MEGLAVGQRRVTGPGRPRDVLVRLARQLLLGERLQPRQVGRQRRKDVIEAVEVDLVLEVGVHAALLFATSSIIGARHAEAQGATCRSDPSQ
jgi:hypothetical protein